MSERIRAQRIADNDPSSVETPGERRERLQKEFVLYTTSWCGPCKRVKAVIEELGLSLITLKDVDRDTGPENRKELARIFVEQGEELPKGSDVIFPYLYNTVRNINGEKKGMRDSEKIMQFLRDTFPLQ